MKKFNKRQLMDQYGFDDQETKIVLEFQKRLPILLDDMEGFCVNARDLWEQLDKPQGKFPNWVSRKFAPYGFVENVDFKASQICDAKKSGVSGMTQAQEYLLTLDMAKSLAMIDKKEIGQIARRYFILMEKAVKKNAEWTLVREPMKQGYKNLMKALNRWMNRRVQRDADDWDYRIEANALNVIATGFEAQDIRIFVGCKDKHTRDSLTVTYNEYLMKLQEWDIMFLGMNMNRYERYEKLREAFNIFYPNAIQIMEDASVIEIQNNKQKLIDEAKDKLFEAA